MSEVARIQNSILIVVTVTLFKKIASSRPAAEVMRKRRGPGNEASAYDVISLLCDDLSLLHSISPENNTGH